jgi:hypothetical protein
MKKKNYKTYFSITSILKKNKQILKKNHKKILKSEEKEEKVIHYE